MALVKRESLMTLEAYARERPAFRDKVMAHKKIRTLAVGPHISLLFEDETTVRYQIQEMLRIEKIFEQAGIEEELASYNPLIPTGREFKATMMIEFTDVEQRRRELARMRGIEDRVWMQVEGADKVFAIADEDLPRGNDEKTSAVHFLRFPLSEDMAAALKYGVALHVGVSHEAYSATVSPVSAVLRNSLVQDLA